MKASGDECVTLITSSGLDQTIAPESAINIGSCLHNIQTPLQIYIIVNITQYSNFSRSAQRPLETALIYLISDLVSNTFNNFFSIRKLQ